MSAACLVHALFGLQHDHPDFQSLIELGETVGTEVMIKPHDPRIKAAFDQMETIIANRIRVLKAQKTASEKLTCVLEYFVSSEAAHLGENTVLKNLLFCS